MFNSNKQVAVYCLVACLAILNLVYGQNDLSSTDSPSIATTGTFAPDTTASATDEATTSQPNLTEVPATSESEATTTNEPSTTPQPETQTSPSSTLPEPSTTFEPETQTSQSSTTPEPNTTFEPETQTSLPSTTAAPETTTQTEETTESTTTTESSEDLEEIGEEIAKKLFKNVGKLQKRSDPMRLTDYDYYVKVGLGLVTTSVHYKLERCSLSGTSKIKSQSVYPVSNPRSPIRQFRGFAQIEKLKLICGGYAESLALKRPLTLKGEIKDIMMRVSFKNYKSSGDVVIDSLVLQRIKVLALDMKVGFTDLSVTKNKFLDHFKIDLHSSIATIVSDLIARDARIVAASMKVQ